MVSIYDDEGGVLIYDLKVEANDSKLLNQKVIKEVLEVKTIERKNSAYAWYNDVNVRKWKANTSITGNLKKTIEKLTKKK